MLYNPAPALIRFILSALLLGLLTLYGIYLASFDIPADLLASYHTPDYSHWFGTDNLGRDVWLRCFQAALTSLQIGSSSAFCCGIIAMLAAGLMQTHPFADRIIQTVIDTLLSLPHLLLLILICFTVGGGKEGVILAIALTHWPRLALILRAETNRIRSSDYLTLSRRLGNGYWYRWREHYIPAMLPQWFVGTLLMFPHAVLHSAALSFLGFGLAPHEPSLGVLLADSLRFITAGKWWLALFPGLLLLTIVLLFDQCARGAQQLWLRNESC